MTNAIESKIQELVTKYGYDAGVLNDFAEFVQSQPKPRKRKTATSTGKTPTTSTRKPKALSLKELQDAVVIAFECSNIKALKKHDAFKLAIAGRDLNLRTKDTWLALYREWVGVPESEQHEEGPSCINGIDVLKNFRPWHVFNLDPHNATSDDINAAFRRLAKQHHPDVGGQREVFERLQKMRDSLLAFR
ncbi:J domain-containing protein [Leptolyngbya sp. UWPOB_LEPTO1]|uniref:J domain-containing protein n=1 Tax=Leptolyngbya sp. UWPOB_LEPTO1 TaxID=2815653 RepID=UPI00257AFD86|nr:J domain-containing protein [Leptolyngbya sp. UWPOB_LEPTO1]